MTTISCLIISIATLFIVNNYGVYGVCPPTTLELFKCDGNERWQGKWICKSFGAEKDGQCSYGCRTSCGRYADSWAQSLANKDSYVHYHLLTDLGHTSCHVNAGNTAFVVCNALAKYP